jgi:hypothetical protein
MAENIKHGKYILELGTGLSKYKQIEYEGWHVSGGKDLNGTKYCGGAVLLTQPFMMVEHTHSHDFDQFIYFLGGDLRNIKDFDAEIEMTLGEGDKLVKYSINYAVCIFIPAGTLHCPLNIKRVGKPITYMDIVLNPVGSMRPLPKASER